MAPLQSLVARLRLPHHARERYPRHCEMSLALVDPDIADHKRRRAAVNCLRAAGGTLPTWSELADPGLIPGAVSSSLKTVGPDERRKKNCWAVLGSTKRNARNRT